MTNTQFEAEACHRVELRKANEKLLAYLAEEIEPERRLPRDTFDEYAKDDQTLARHLLGVLLRKAIDHNPEGATYLLVGDALKKVEVTPEALLTTLEDLKNIFEKVPRLYTPPTPDRTQCGARPIEFATLGAASIEQASFRELVKRTIEHLNSEEITTMPIDVEIAFFDYSNEALATCLISTMLDVIRSDQEKLETAAETMELADKTLKLMLEAAQAKDAWIKKKGLLYPDRDLKKAA